MNNLHPNSVGVIFCTSKISSRGREFEKVADCEVIQVAQAVKAALEEKGCRAELVDLDPDRIADLRKYDWVFNLAEPIDCFPLTEDEIAVQMEKLNINFTGSGSDTLNACLDKSVTKAELLKYGITTPVYDVFQPGDRIITKCRFPVFVKPVHEDGSIGISKTRLPEMKPGLPCRLRKSILSTIRQHWSRNL